MAGSWGILGSYGVRAKVDGQDFAERYLLGLNIEAGEEAG